MANLTFKGNNYTDQGWHFALYQKYPQELGLKSIAWKQLILSKAQKSGPTRGSCSWTMHFKVTVAKQQSGGIYIGAVELQKKVTVTKQLWMEDMFRLTRLARVILDISISKTSKIGLSTRLSDMSICLR